MSRKYRFGDSSELYFIRYAVINWMDLFIKKEYNGFDRFELYCLMEATSEMAPEGVNSTTSKIKMIGKVT